ncbi:type VI secretion system tip protein VgrG, partial [Pseudomonas sp. MYb185]
EGFNELRIEDRAGEEQIFIHAQRDWDQNIQHDQKIRVGNERHERIEANRYTENLAEEHHTTHGDRKTEVKADDHLTVGNNQHIKLGQGQFIEAGQEIHLSSGMKVVLEAGSEITFKVGGSFVKLDPSGVTLVGPSVKMNSGGSPGKGSGAAPRLPGDTVAAETDEPGGLLSVRLKEASRDSMPFVELCQKPRGGTPAQCPLADCPCRKASGIGS